MMVDTCMTPPTATPLNLLLVERQLLQGGDLAVVVLSTAAHKLLCDWAIESGQNIMLHVHPHDSSTQIHSVHKYRIIYTLAL